MFNSIFPFPVQATAQSAVDSAIVVPFGAASAWIDDCFNWWLALDF